MKVCGNPANNHEKSLKILHFLSGIIAKRIHHVCTAARVACRRWISNFSNHVFPFVRKTEINGNNNKGQYDWWTSRKTSAAGVDHWKGVTVRVASRLPSRLQVDAYLLVTDTAWRAGRVSALWSAFTQGSESFQLTDFSRKKTVALTECLVGKLVLTKFGSALL